MKPNVGTIALGVWLQLAGCALSPQTTDLVDDTSEQPLLSETEFMDYLRNWYTIVLRSSRLPSDASQQRAKDRIAALGGTNIVLLPEIGVAFARFADGSAAPPRYTPFGETVAPLRMYAAAGQPTLPQLLDGDLSQLTSQSSRQFSSSNTSPPTHRAVSRADRVYDNDWGLRVTNAPDAWNTSTGSHQTVVAIVDSGVATNHPDLRRNLGDRQHCFTLSSQMGLRSCNPYPESHWHGTHIAGTIAARFGGGEAVGVGPNLGLASYRVFEAFPVNTDIDRDGDKELIYANWASDITILPAILDAIDRGYQVINLSLGSTFWVSEQIPNWRQMAVFRQIGERLAQHAAIRNTTVVVAAGNNDGFELFGHNWGNLDDSWTTHFPAEVESFVTVGGLALRRAPTTGDELHKAAYSSFGRVIDIAAPGGDRGPSEEVPDETYGIISTSVDLDLFSESLTAGLTDQPYTPPSCIRSYDCSVGYRYATGTSMATPHVAATVGLMLDVAPSTPAAGIATILKNTAQIRPHLYPARVGQVVDVAAAVRHVAQ